MVVLSVWPLSQWQDVLPALAQCSRGRRKCAVMLHGDPAGLEKNGPEIARKLREHCEREGLNVPEIWLGVAGDVGISSARNVMRALSATDPRRDEKIKKLRAGLQTLRMRAVRAAVKCGAAALMFDPEAAWKSKLPGFDGEAAREFCRAARAALDAALGSGEVAQRVRLLATSYDMPGYHAIPWHEWDELLDDWAPQVYFAGTTEPAPDSKRGESRYKRHNAHWKDAQRCGVLSSRPLRTVYLQAYRCLVRELCRVANLYDDVCFWTFSRGRHDARGTLAACALAEIEARGFTGPGRIQRFQTSAGLVADGLVGPKTLAALGLA